MKPTMLYILPLIAIVICLTTPVFSGDPPAHRSARSGRQWRNKRLLARWAVFSLLAATVITRVWPAHGLPETLQGAALAGFIFLPVFIYMLLAKIWRTFNRSGKAAQADKRAETGESGKQVDVSNFTGYPSDSLLADTQRRAASSVDLTAARRPGRTSGNSNPAPAPVAASGRATEHPLDPFPDPRLEVDADLVADSAADAFADLDATWASAAPADSDTARTSASRAAFNASQTSAPRADHDARRTSATHADLNAPQTSAVHADLDASQTSSPSAGTDVPQTPASTVATDATQAKENPAENDATQYTDSMLDLDATVAADSTLDFDAILADDATLDPDSTVSLHMKNFETVHDYHDVGVDAELEKGFADNDPSGTTSRSTTETAIALAKSSFASQMENMRNDSDQYLPAPEKAKLTQLINTLKSDKLKLQKLVIAQQAAINSERQAHSKTRKVAKDAIRIMRDARQGQNIAEKIARRERAERQRLQGDYTKVKRALNNAMSTLHAQRIKEEEADTSTQ